MDGLTRTDKLEECLRLINICIDLLDQAYDNHLEDSKMSEEDWGILGEKKDV